MTTNDKCIVTWLYNAKKKRQKIFLPSFYGWDSTAERLKPLRGGSLLFTTKFPEFPGTHFYQPQKDERLSYQVDLNTGPLEWESSALTTRPLLGS